MRAEQPGTEHKRDVSKSLGTQMARTRSFRQRFASAIAGLLCIFTFFAVALTTWKLDGPLNQPLCLERAPFVKPLSPHQAVFIARVLYAGRTDRDFSSGHEWGHWALARVEHRYWGLPWWSSEVVFLANGGFEKGKAYFVDGDRSSLVSYFVPLVDIGTCTRSAPLERADIDLRILRDGPPKAGVRIVGRVFRQSSGRPQVAPGVKVEITGPAGPLFVNSDERGVYDALGLPPGHYSLSVGSAEPERSQFSFQNDLEAGDVWGRTLWVK